VGNCKEECPAKVLPLWWSRTEVLEEVGKTYPRLDLLGGLDYLLDILFPRDLPAVVPQYLEVPQEGEEGIPDIDPCDPVEEIHFLVCIPDCLLVLYPLTYVPDKAAAGLPTTIIQVRDDDVNWYPGPLPAEEGGLYVVMPGYPGCIPDLLPFSIRGDPLDLLPCEIEGLFPVNSRGCP